MVQNIDEVDETFLVILPPIIQLTLLNAMKLKGCTNVCIKSCVDPSPSRHVNFFIIGSWITIVLLDRIDTEQCVTFQKWLFPDFIRTDTYLRGGKEPSCSNTYEMPLYQSLQQWMESRRFKRHNNRKHHRRSIRGSGEFDSLQGTTAKEIPPSERFNIIVHLTDFHILTKSKCILINHLDLLVNDRFYCPSRGTFKSLPLVGVRCRIETRYHFFGWIVHANIKIILPPFFIIFCMQFVIIVIYIIRPLFMSSCDPNNCFVIFVVAIIVVLRAMSIKSF